MTELAPFMSTLFPSVKKAAEAAIERSEDSRQWTTAAESELKNRVDAMMGDTVRRAIIQGVITDILYLEETDEAKFTDWYNNGGLI